jgi:exopolyphosphatase / guanosine-5'-triphosphate,3'-diphosphate pyrophosphatase
MLSSLREQLTPALAEFQLGERRMIGTGGTLTSTAGMLMELKKFDAARIHHYVVPRLTLESRFRALAALDLAGLEQVTGLPGKRADIIVPGMAVFLVAMELLGAAEIMVSVRGLRYGVLERLLREP